MSNGAQRNEAAVTSELSSKGLPRLSSIFSLKLIIWLIVLLIDRSRRGGSNGGVIKKSGHFRPRLFRPANGQFFIAT